MTREEEDRFEALAARVTLLELLLAGLAGRAREEGSVEEQLITMKPGGEFKIDYDPDTRTTSIAMSRDDRDIALDVRTVIDEEDQKGHRESSITYSLYGPSLKRARDGWQGHLVNDTSDRVVAGATVEDLIVALQWLVGKGEMSPKAVPDDRAEGA